MGVLSDLIDDKAIRLDANPSNWEEAIREAGALLEQTGVASEVYTQSMIDSVHKNGPYIVVAPGFAFAHARPSEAVKRTGMSWLRLAEPVEFGHKTNDPVTLVVALAATDTKTHQKAMMQLAGLLGDQQKRAALDAAETPEEIHSLLSDAGSNDKHSLLSYEEPEQASPAKKSGKSKSGGSSTKNHIMTVCGNGVGTSLFLKNTLEKVLSTWGWSSYITVEATDTVSAKGKANEADLIMTSGEIAKALGDLGVPMKVIENFTSTNEIDSALRELYDI